MSELANDNVVYNGEVMMLIIMVIGSLLLISIIIAIILIKFIDYVESFINKRKLRRIFNTLIIDKSSMLDNVSVNTIDIVNNLSVNKVDIIKYDGNNIYLKINLSNNNTDKKVIK